MVGRNGKILNLLNEIKIVLAMLSILPANVGHLGAV